MDPLALQEKVEDAVAAKLDAREAFTTVDISHPIIHEDSSVRHREVKDVFQGIIDRGDLEDANYTSSTITVYPQPNKSARVRLFHPDEPNLMSAVILIRSNT